MPNLFKTHKTLFELKNFEQKFENCFWQSSISKFFRDHIWNGTNLRANYVYGVWHNPNKLKHHNVPNICLVPLCTFARLHTYNLTKANQSQAWVQKRAVGNTFSRRYYKIKIYIYINCSLVSLCTRQAFNFANLSTVFSVDKFAKSAQFSLFEQEIISSLQIHGPCLKLISSWIITPFRITNWQTCAFLQPCTVLKPGRA